MSGLRERKKQATREALTAAALRLALERGLDNVRVEDIAAEAGVSPRTYNNYFASKYEAITALHADRTGRAVAAALRARPAGEPLWDALTEAMVAPWARGSVAEDPADGPPDAEVVASARLLADEPALRAEALRTALAADGELAAAVAARVGADVGRDLYPSLVAATATAAVQTAVTHWLRADPPRPLVPVLREALGAVAAGLPVPSRDGRARVPRG